MKANSYCNILPWHGSFSLFLTLYGKQGRTEHLSLPFSWFVCVFKSIPYFHLYTNRWLQPYFQSLIKINHNDSKEALKSHDPDTELAQPSTACYWHCWSAVSASATDIKPREQHTCRELSTQKGFNSGSTRKNMVWNKTWPQEIDLLVVNRLDRKIKFTFSSANAMASETHNYHSREMVLHPSHVLKLWAEKNVPTL